MNFFLKKLFALRSRALPMATTKLEQFWEEEPFTFEGYRGTKFIWPSDRPFVMEADGGVSGVDFFRISPTITPETLLRNVIQNCLASNHPWHVNNLNHLHLIFIRDYSIVGAFAYYRKATIVRDFYKNIQVHDRMTGFGLYPTRRAP